MFILTVFIVCIAMALQDILGTICVVAQAKGRDKLAGLMDALGDVARLIGIVAGVDALQKGVNVHSMIILCGLCATSYFVTSRTTKWAKCLVDKSVCEPSEASVY